MEHSIGDIFIVNHIHNGQTVLQVEPSDTCDGCFFNTYPIHDCPLYFEELGLCADAFRSDKKSIIFKNVKA